MKKIISVVLAVCFVIGAFCMPVAATHADQTSTDYIQVGTTARDLRAYGVHTFVSNYIHGAAPVMDGKISTDEYNSGNVPSDVAKIGDGLSLTNSTGTSDYTADFGEDYKGFTVKSFLSYDDTYAYIAEEVTSDKAISDVNSLGTPSPINTSVRYGLNQSELVPEFVSRLSNSYSYEMVGGNLVLSSLSSADRNYKKLEGTVNTTAITDTEAYNDGVVTWNRDEYKKPENAACEYTVDQGTHKYVFEYRIPLADVIYSATGRFSKEDVASILASDFYGSYFFQVAVTRTGGADKNKQFFLSTGYAANTPKLPYSAKSADAKATTWGKAVREYWTTLAGESLSIPYVPSPVYHGSKTAGTVTLPAASQFRPGLSGFGLNEIKSIYEIGSTASFSVIPDAVENTSPMVGDIRVVPTQFRIRNGFDTKLTGTFNDDYKTASFDTSKLPVGLSTLVVTFSQQRFDGTNWVNTGVSKNFSRNITIAGSVLGSAQEGASQTGDSLAVVIACSSVMALAAVAAGVLIYKKKRSF